MQVWQAVDISKNLNEINKEFLRMQSVIASQQELSNIEPISNLANQIKEERSKQKLTQKMLSELSGVSESSVQKVERGDNSIQFNIVTDILNTLGLKLWIG